MGYINYIKCSSVVYIACLVFGLTGFAIESNTDALGKPNNGHSGITGVGNRVAE